MLLQQLRLSICIFLFSAIFFSVTYGQYTVYNNFGPDHDGWDYNYGLGWTIAGIDVPQQYGVEQAQEFQSSVTGVLTDIWIAILKVPSSAPLDTVTVRLTENPSGLPPTEADIMEEWTLTSFQGWSQWSAPHHLEGNGTSQLVQGGSYWIWAIAEETTWCMWALNVDPELTIPHTIRREDEDWLPIANETAAAFRVDVIEGLVDVEPIKNSQQLSSLSQNFPNPFAGNTTIQYSLAAAEYVILKIYDIYGNEVKTLVNEYKNAGEHTISFDGNNLKAGIYFYKLQVGNHVVDIKKMSCME